MGEENLKCKIMLKTLNAGNVAGKVRINFEAVVMDPSLDMLDFFTKLFQNQGGEIEMRMDMDGSVQVDMRTNRS